MKQKRDGPLRTGHTPNQYGGTLLLALFATGEFDGPGAAVRFDPSSREFVN